MVAVVALVVLIAVWRFAVVFGAAVFEGVGLSGSAAGFESRSALVGAGYTTSQSEAVVENPVTRRVAAGLIVFGYFGPPALVALLGATFVIPTDEDLADRLLALIVMLFALFLLDRAGFFQRVGARPARRLARRMLGTTAVDNWVTVGDHVVAEVIVPPDEVQAGAIIDALTADHVRVLARCVVVALGGLGESEPGVVDRDAAEALLEPDDDAPVEEAPRGVSVQEQDGVSHALVHVVNRPDAAFEPSRLERKEPRVGRERAVPPAIRVELHLRVRRDALLRQRVVRQCRLYVQ